MGRLIDADKLKDIVEYMCDEDGSEEALKWCNWFKEVINAEYNRRQKKVKPIKASPQLSVEDSKKIIKEVNTKPNYKKIQKLKEIINEVLEQEPRWIPVSERLPKIAGVYRVTRYYPNNVMNPNYLVDACCFDGSNTWYNDNRINHERAYADNVIAWQENPKPYKAYREVEE